MSSFYQKITKERYLEISEFDVEQDEEEKTSLVKRKIIEAKPMSEEEAILQMELLGHTFYVYKDMKTDKVNVLYKRYDGTYGVIETN